LGLGSGLGLGLALDLAACLGQIDRRQAGADLAVRGEWPVLWYDVVGQRGEAEERRTERLLVEEGRHIHVHQPIRVRVRVRVRARATVRVRIRVRVRVSGSDDTFGPSRP